MSEITDRERIEWVKKHPELQKAFETAKDYLGQVSVGEYVRRARRTIDAVILAEKDLPKSPKTKAMSSKRDMLTVKGVDGRNFNVRLILKGDRYGRSAVHDKDEPIMLIRLRANDHTYPPQVAVRDNMRGNTMTNNINGRT